MNELIPFKFENRNVRVVILDGAEWWVARDVAVALAYKNYTDAITRHCKGVVNHYPLQTAGGKQEVRILSEGDVWRLITHSNLPEAQRFEKWLFEEVLPRIRKTGAFMNERERMALESERELQKTYFAHGGRAALFEAKKIEITVDAAARKKQRGFAEKKQRELQQGGN